MRLGANLDRDVASHVAFAKRGETYFLRRGTDADLRFLNRETIEDLEIFRLDPQFTGEAARRFEREGQFDIEGPAIPRHEHQAEQPGEGHRASCELPLEFVAVFESDRPRQWCTANETSHIRQDDFRQRHLDIGLD